MIKIDINRMAYSTDGKKEFYPLPIGVDVREDIEVYGRLRNDHKVAWRSDGALYSSVQSPRIHLSGWGRIRTFPSKEFKEGLSLEHPVLQVIDRRERNFLLAICFYILQDKFKRAEKVEFMEKVLAEVKGDSPDIRQGHLKAYSFRTEIPEGMGVKKRRFRMLNHEFHCEVPFVWIEADYDGQYIAVADIPKKNFYIASPDHLDSPVRLWGGKYIFIHPEPGID